MVKGVAGLSFLADGLSRGASEKDGSISMSRIYYRLTAKEKGSARLTFILFISLLSILLRRLTCLSIADVRLQKRP